MDSNQTSISSTRSALVAIVAAEAPTYAIAFAKQASRRTWAFHKAGTVALCSHKSQVLANGVPWFRFVVGVRKRSRSEKSWKSYEA